MVSSIGVGGTTHEFILQNGIFKPLIIPEWSFIAENFDGTTTVDHSDGQLRKSVDVQALLVTVPGGPSATAKYFSLAEFLRQNMNTPLTLRLDLDGGDIVKTYAGKINGESPIGQVNANSPKMVPISFQFILTQLTW